MRGRKVFTMRIGRALIVQEKHFLTVEATKRPGLYELPGGKINKEETIPEGVNREVFEETLVQMRSGWVLYEMIDYDYFDGRSRINLSYTVYISNDFTTTGYPQVPNEEIAAVVWLPLRKLDKLPLARMSRQHVLLYLHQTRTGALLPSPHS
jgi:8-oxo-dGTP pyrophosphatase MutT (NUDIX family)